MVGTTLFEILVFNFWTLPVGAMAAFLGFWMGSRGFDPSAPSPLRPVVLGLELAAGTFITGLAIMLALEQYTPKVVEELDGASGLVLFGAHLMLDVAPGLLAFSLSYGLAVLLKRRQSEQIPPDA